jgi:hypothetical protein
LRSIVRHRRSVVLRAGLGLVGALIAAGLIAGCGGGGSGSSSTVAVSAAQLHAAKRAGEEKAHEQDRVNNLQKQVRALKHKVNHRAPSHAAATVSAAPAPEPATTPAAAPESTEPVRSFHAPSGNVSCQVFIDGATCSVESIGETFVFEAGGPARIEPIATLPRSLGELADYGTTVSAGSITCEVPPSDVARGITCSDASSGHGFEASRVESRQSAY